MTTLITGGNGFIGAEIAKLLLERGDQDVVSFDIAPAGDRHGDGVVSIRGDLGNFGQVLNAVETTRPSRIFHRSPSGCAPTPACRSSTTRTRRSRCCSSPRRRASGSRRSSTCSRGSPPTPTAGELAAAVRARIPDAEIAFEVDEGIQALLDRLALPIDDTRARAEWGWEPSYQLDATIEDFLNELGG